MKSAELGTIDAACFRTREAFSREDNAASKCSIEESANLESKIGELLDFIRATSTQALCATLHAMWFTAANGKIVAEKFGLSSPQRQTTYLLGLAMTTPEPEAPAALTEERWKRICELLNDIVDAYVQPAMTTAAAGTVEPEKVHVASMAFMQRFMSGRLVVAEQLIDLIRETCVPFDSLLKDAIGVTATESIAILAWLLKCIEDKANTARDGMVQVKDLYRRSGGDVSAFGPDSAEYKAGQAAFEKYRAWSADPNTFAIAELENDFSAETSAAFLKQFALNRGSISDFRYFASPNPPNPAELSPLVMRGDGRFSVPVFAIVYGALYDTLDACLRATKHCERYLKARSDYLERRANALLTRLFPDAKVSIESYYETARAENEHDGLILCANDVLLAIEAKSAPMKTPSRDIERSFRNLSDQFKSNRGIQHAYEQALRVVDLVQTAKAAVSFYDAKGNQIANIDAPASDAYAICVTLESFGVIAIDPTLLLDVPEGAQYPIIFNLFDLETLVDGFEEKGLTGKDFLEYLRQRRDAQGRIQSDDELNLAAQFILEGKLSAPEGDAVHFVQGYADWFDDVYMRKHGVETGLMDGYVPGGVSMDLKKSLSAGQPVFVAASSTPVIRSAKKIGRNELCPCGSKKKYKKCHGAT